MGARIYLPGIGRFTSVDPIEGGVDNNYVYPTDPVNEYDLDGTMSTPIYMTQIYYPGNPGERCAQNQYCSTLGIFVPIAGGFKVVTMLTKAKSFAPVAVKTKEFFAKNNLFRLNSKRIAFGPAQSHYKAGTLRPSSIPYHFEINWKKGKIFLEDTRLPKGKTIRFCFGRGCY